MKVAHYTWKEFLKSDSKKVLDYERYAIFHKK